MSKNLHDVWNLFKNACTDARINPNKRKEAGNALWMVLVESGKTRKECEAATKINRGTMDSWLAGTNIPSITNMYNLEKFFLKEIQKESLKFLTDKRFRGVINLYLEEEKLGNIISEEELMGLFNLVEKSKGDLPIETLRIFIGLPTEKE